MYNNNRNSLPEHRFDVKICSRFHCRRADGTDYSSHFGSEALEAIAENPTQRVLLQILILIFRR